MGIHFYKRIFNWTWWIGLLCHFSFALAAFKYVKAKHRENQSLSCLAVNKGSEREDLYKVGKRKARSKNFKRGGKCRKGIIRGRSGKENEGRLKRKCKS